MTLRAAFVREVSRPGRTPLHQVVVQFWAASADGRDRLATAVLNGPGWASRRRAVTFTHDLARSWGAR